MLDILVRRIRRAVSRAIDAGCSAGLYGPNGLDRLYAGFLRI